MRKNRIAVWLLLVVPMLFAGCSAVGDKAASVSAIYGAAAVISLLLLVGYCVISQKRDPWYLLLFASILVVNIGYFSLAISGNLEAALMANRFAYLGSVFLPLSMWMIILNVTHIRSPKWLVWALLGLAVVVFLIAASPGYLQIYYRDVRFTKIDGVTVLQKVYGPLHSIYLVYLLGYFTAMVAAIVYATWKNKIESTAYAVILAIAVLVNIGVWLIEQLVHIDFELLSVSYIISESFLLGLYVLMAEAEKKKQLYMQKISAEAASEKSLPEEDGEALERIAQFRVGLDHLTPKERELYQCYIAGLTTDVIMEKLAIKENTLKFHSKNLYGKLGVKSRKQLMELQKKLP